MKKGQIDTKQEMYDKIHALMTEVLEIKAQSLVRSYICFTSTGHRRHAFNLIKDEKSNIWRIECYNCKNEGSIENDISKSGIRRSFTELWDFVKNMENKGQTPYFIYLIEIEGKIYVGATKQAWGLRFQSEVRAAFTKKNTKGEKLNQYYYYLSQAIRDYTEKIIKQRGLKNLDINEKIQIAMDEIGLYLWQVCETEKEMFNGEMFWIGATHSQFREIGLNVVEGGQGAGRAPRVLNQEIIPYFKQLLKLSYNKHLRDGPYQFILDKLNSIKTEYGYDKVTQITKADVDNTIELLFTYDVILGDGSIIKKIPTYMDLREQEQSAKIINYLTQGKDISRLPKELSISKSRIKQLLAKDQIVIPIALINALTIGDIDAIQRLQEFISESKNIRDIDIYTSKILISFKKNGIVYNINNLKSINSLYYKIINMEKALENIDLNTNYLKK